MFHKELADIIIEKNIRGVSSRMVVDLESTTIKQLILNPGDKIPEHIVPVDVTFFVLEGEGIIYVADKAYDVKPHSIVLCPKNTTMRVEAKNNLFSFLNIKTPGFKPTK